MTVTLEMPPIANEADAVASVTPTLGRGGQVESRVTVGVSHVTKIEDEAVAQLHRADTDLLRVTMRVSFRPARDEYLEQVLFSVLLQPEDPGIQSRPPIAFALAPSRLTSGPFTMRSGLTLGLHAGAPGLEVKAESEDTVQKELHQPYVVAAGEGESDPEWRYQRTETMGLEGSHEMGMIVELQKDLAAEAFISLAGSVISGRQRIDVVWELDNRIARVPLRATE